LNVLLHTVFSTLIVKAGSFDDPQPSDNELAKRFGRCLTCNEIVHFSRIVNRWVYDEGTFHTGHLIEFPIDWIPLKTPIQIKIQLQQKAETA
jgi:hypothetical protein